MISSPQLAGFPVQESWYVERETFIGLDNGGQPRIVVHPSTLMRLKNNGRVPFFTAFGAGERELQRDRRRRARS